MFNLDTCKFVVWGIKTGGNSFRYIHEAFYRALVHMGKDVQWLDQTEDISRIDFANTFFIGMNHALRGMPQRQDCFYAIHNVENQAKEYLSGLRYMNYGLYVSTMSIPANAINLAKDTYFFPQGWEAYDSVVFRWGTNLLPHEIEANKPTDIFRKDSKVINYIGCSTGEWGDVLMPFGQAARENGITFRVLSDIDHDEHVRLIKESYMAPAINIKYQTDVGYVPCRVFKALSFGQMAVTNNEHATRLFGERLIYNPDPRELFYQAKEVLSQEDIPVRTLHDLMDVVARDHTYLNKIDAILKSARLSLETR